MASNASAMANAKEKMRTTFKIATKLSCDHESCECRGWRPKPEPIKNAQFPCSACSHPLATHGNLIGLPMDSLRKLSDISTQIEVHLNQAKQATDIKQGKLFIERAAALQQCVYIFYNFF